MRDSVRWKASFTLIACFSGWRTQQATPAASEISCAGQPQSLASVAHTSTRSGAP